MSRVESSRRRVVLMAGAVAPIAVALALSTTGQGCNGCNPNGCNPPGPPVVNVVTHHYDNLRSGANLHETTLTPLAVRSGNFGRLFARHVDGQPYAQPLYVHGLDFGANGKHNVVLSATERNFVYAFDADDARQTAPLWTRWLGPPGQQSDSCPDLRPWVGVTSTPVIDVATNTMYVVNKTDGGADACPYVSHHVAHQLHALDLVTGLDKMPPTTICAELPSYSSDRKSIQFDSFYQHNRPALLLDHGVIWMAFGSHCDRDPYWGWVFAYDAKTLRVASTPWLTTPRGSEGSIWQAGNGLAADADGNVYFMTGNGDVDTQHTPPDVSMSFVKLRLDNERGGIALSSYFTVPNHRFLNQWPNDLDTGSSGPLLIPGTDLITGGGKDGQVYLLNRANMTHRQDFNATPDDEGENHLHASPIFWEGPAGGRIYFCPEEEVLHAYAFDRNAGYYLGGDVTRHRIDSDVLCSVEMPGGFMALSANGNRDGIIWLNHPYDGGDDNGDGAVAALTAVDATTMRALFDSRNRPENALGTYAKFSPPVVAEGKVFVNAFDPFENGRGQVANGSVVVYGMRCSPSCGPGQYCVNGQCQGCTPDDIKRACGGECDIPDTCGGTCKCPSGMTCGGGPEIGARTEMRNGPPLPPPGGGGGGGSGSSHECVCSAETIKKNCGNQCNVPDGCGGTCACIGDGQSCDPTTHTCCDWQAECAKAGACALVCGEVQCPCTEGSYCDASGKCCAKRCNANTVCGAPDGCGGYCFGKCAPKEECVADGDSASCQPIAIPCRKNPRFCDVNPEELISTCNKNPWACYVNLGRKHHKHHGEPMPKSKHPAPSAPSAP